MSYNFPNSPTLNQLWPQPAVAGQPVYQWDGQKWILSTAGTVFPPVMVAFSISGKPATNINIMIPMTSAVTVPAALAGSQACANTATTAATAFTLSKVSGGTATSIGTITIAAGSKNSFTLAGAGAALAIGDALMLTTPSTQDATLADVGITIAVTK